MARVDAAGGLAVAAVAGFLVAALIAASAAGRFRSLAGLLTIVLFAASFVVILFGRPEYYVYFGCDRFVYRYTIYPAAMFSLAVVAAIDGLPPGRVRVLAGTSVLGLLVCGRGAHSS